jgi:hypothetical protein
MRGEYEIFMQYISPETKQAPQVCRIKINWKTNNIMDLNQVRYEDMNMI